MLTVHFFDQTAANKNPRNNKSSKVISLRLAVAVYCIHNDLIYSIPKQKWRAGVWALRSGCEAGNNGGSLGEVCFREVKDTEGSVEASRVEGEG